MKKGTQIRGREEGEERKEKKKIDAKKQKSSGQTTGGAIGKLKGLNGPEKQLKESDLRKVSSPERKDLENQKNATKGRKRVGKIKRSLPGPFYGLWSCSQRGQLREERISGKGGGGKTQKRRRGEGSR